MTMRWTLLPAAAILLLATSPARATSYTSAANGHWTTATAWTPNGVPGSGDTVTIGHSITIDATDGPITVGDGTTVAITLNVVLSGGAPAAGTGYLTVSGQTLTIRGGLNIGPGYVTDFPAGTIQQLTLQTTSGVAGTMLFDASSGVTPAVQVGEESLWVVAGTSAVPCVVRTKSGSAGNNFKVVGYGPQSSGNLQWSYATVTYIGASGYNAIQNQQYYPGQVWSLDHCTFDQYGTVSPNVSDGSSIVSVTHCTFSANYLGAYPLVFSGTNAITTGTRLIDSNVFLAMPYFLSSQAYTITNNFITLDAGNTFSQNTGPLWSKCDSNFFYKNLDHESITNGPVTNCYYLLGLGSTAGSSGLLATSYASTTFANNLFQWAGSGDNQLSAIGGAEEGSDAVTITVTGNIVLPSGSNGASFNLAGTYGNSGGTPTTRPMVVEHNTCAMGASGSGAGGVYTFSSAHPNTQVSNEILSLRSNLFFRANSTGAALLTNEGGAWAVVDSVPASVCGYNAYTTLDLTPSGQWSAVTGDTNHEAGTPYNSPMSGTAAPGAHDIQLGSVSSVQTAGPRFVAPARNVFAWAAQLQPPVGDGTMTTGNIATVTGYIQSHLDQIAPMVAWVKGGFAPQNTALKGASYPGDASAADAAGNPWPGGAPGIGAMALAAAPVPVINGGLRRRTSAPAGAPRPVLRGTPRLDADNPHRYRRKAA